MYRVGACQLVSISANPIDAAAAWCTHDVRELCCCLSRDWRGAMCAANTPAVPPQLWHNDPATKLAGYTKSMRNMIGDDRRSHYGVPQSRRTQS